jgi:hypothetical protein
MPVLFYISYNIIIITMISAIQIYSRNRAITASQALARIYEELIIIRWPPVKSIYIAHPGHDLITMPQDATAEDFINKYYNSLDRWLNRPHAFKNMRFTEYFGSVQMLSIIAKRPLPSTIPVDDIHMDKFQNSPNWIWLNTHGRCLRRIMPVHLENSESFWSRLLLMQPDC